MAVLCGASLRLSLAVCLLISTVTCYPPAKGQGSAAAPGGLAGWRSTSGANAPNYGATVSRASYPYAGAGAAVGSAGGAGGFSAPHATGSFHRGYASNAGVPSTGYNTPLFYGYSNAAPAGGAVSGYGNAGSGSAGAGLYETSPVTADGDAGFWSVFSDVSDLEPVYSYRSASSYQHGRDHFSQTRYTPYEEQPVFAPAVQDVSVKGGY